MLREKVQAADPRGRKYRYADQALIAKGHATRVMTPLVNCHLEEPIRYGGGRQLSMDSTSRMTGDSHARICERLEYQSTAVVS